MAFISQRIYLELAQIAEAARQGQIGREQAEYFSYESYQLEMMQFQLLSTLHQILENDIAKAAQQSGAPQLRESTGPSLGVGQAVPTRTPRERNVAVPVPLAQ